MVKVLFSGSIDESSWDIFFERVNEVQFSPHGPFDLLFLTGKAFNSLEHYEQHKERLKALAPLAVYIQNNVSIDEDNIHFLPGRVGMINTVKNLTVCYALELSDETYQADITPIRQIVSNLSYRGCDALITSAWPREAHQFLETDLADFQATNIGYGGTRWAAEMALLVKPRYHFIPERCFYQRIPYRNAPAPFTRLIALAPICTAVEAKEKGKKWLHALSFQPIIYLKPAELEEVPAAYSQCPYAPIGGAANREAVPGPPSKKARFESADTTSSSFFFGTQAAPAASLNLTASKDAKTLFLGGLGRDTHEGALKDILTGVHALRRPPGKNYVFVEFQSHEAACKVVEQASRRGLTLQGRKLTVGWAGPQEDDLATLLRDRVIIPPTEDAKTLYLGNLPAEPKDAVLADIQALFPKAVDVQLVPGKPFAFVDFDSYQDAMDAMSGSLQELPRIQGRQIVVGWSKGSSASSPPHPDCRVLYLGNLAGVTEDELKTNWAGVRCIRRPAGGDFAFVEFATSALAQTAMDQGMGDRKIGWAKGKPAAACDESQECWFCLSSPMFKAHLVVSVGQHNYLALPRGAINPQHVLVCPIDCVPSRVHLSADGKVELTAFCQSISKFYTSLGMVMICFERAIRTKSGRDHMQVHCVPIPATKLAQVMGVFQAKADEYSLHFHELSEPVEQAVLSMEGGPYQEYFYIDLPAAEGRKQFVYVQEEGAHAFPMQFGIEVAVTILGCPERVHWKHCLLTEGQEEEQTVAFRNDFTPFDFTLS